MSENALGRVLERIHEVAQLAGIRGEVDLEQGMFHAPFELADGSRLAVLIQPVQVSDEPVFAITVSCPVLRFSERQPISDDMAMELLRRNERMYCARYGIRDLEEGGLVVASVDHPLETLDAPELQALVQSVVRAASELMQMLR